MFKGETTHKFKSICFRRWSRKNFAIFAGLKANIVIGSLATEIVDSLLPKTKTIDANISTDTISNRTESSIDEILSMGQTSIAMGQQEPFFCSSFLKIAIASISTNAGDSTAYNTTNKIIRGVSDFRYSPFCI